MKIYLVRHGEKEHDGDDASLSEEGVRQIQLLARRLSVAQKFKVTRIYSTSHMHSIETATILSKTLYAPVFRDDRFNEFDDGIFEREFYEKDYENFEGLHAFLDEIVALKQDVVLAMHGAINRAVISYLTGMGLADTQLLSMDYASISRLELRDVDGVMKWRIGALNDTQHLRFA